MIENKVSNSYISKMLKEIAAAYEVTGEDRFKIKAYQNAAAGVEHSTSEVKDLWEEGKLREVPGIGSSIFGHLDEYFKTGKVLHFELVTKGLPKGMFGLFGLQGIGAKTAYRLAKAFNLKNKENALEVVKKAAQNGKIRSLEGFGEQSEKDILSVLNNVTPNKEARARMLLPDATEISQRYSSYMKAAGGCERVEVLGSLRRRCATVGDLDFAVVSSESAKVISNFVKYKEVWEILSEGDVKASVLLKNGVRVDLMVEKKEGFGSLSQHFTGSKAHNIALRKYALDKGMSLSEHGIKYKNKMRSFEDEEEFYNFLGLELIPAELREDMGEIEASKNGTLPGLIKLEDVKGDLHSHTVLSDGNNTLEEMVFAAKAMNYRYVGITDHAPSIVSRGDKEVERIIDDTRVKIEHINSSDDTIRVLFGYEVNILSDATLSLSDKFLSKLDFVIAAIHTSFNQDRKTITDRLLSAIRNPYVSIIAHPTGRLINSRDSYDADWELVFEEALKQRKILEINSYPQRLDLPDILVREATKKGLKLVINTDAHHIEQFGLMRYGIDIARRGWVTKRDIINTLPLDKLLKELNKKR